MISTDAGIQGIGEACAYGVPGRIRDWVSWLSPIAKALLTSRIGQRVRFKFPDGEKELEIVGIAYE